MPRGGGMRFVWSVGIATGAIAAWGALAVGISSSDFSSAFDITTSEWIRLTPALSLLAGVAAAVLVHGALVRAR
ncbi:MAG: hypothetical protein JNK53_08130 [Phycisphaerae bacterium]|nr:hypothetical protein [Phycisphaerae bacterium]